MRYLFIFFLFGFVHAQKRAVNLGSQHVRFNFDGGFFKVGDRGLCGDFNLLDFSIDTIKITSNSTRIRNGKSVMQDFFGFPISFFGIEDTSASGVIFNGYQLFDNGTSTWREMGSYGFNFNSNVFLHNIIGIDNDDISSTIAKGDTTYNYLMKWGEGVKLRVFENTNNLETGLYITDGLDKISMKSFDDSLSFEFAVDKFGIKSSALPEYQNDSLALYSMGVGRYYTLVGENIVRISK